MTQEILNEIASNTTPEPIYNTILIGVSITIIASSVWYLFKKSWDK